MPSQTGQVSVRFSVQDQEVVRRALAQLGADGDAALRKIDAAGRAPSPGLRSLSEAISQLKDRVFDSSTVLGSFGNVLRAAGPVGLTVAAVLGTLYLAFGKVSDGAKQFRQMARDIKETAEAAGLATDASQAVVDMLQRHGVAADKAATGLNRFAAESANSARGQGELFDALRRLDPELAKQFALASDQTQRLQIFIEALARSSDEAQRAQLGRLAFGRGSAGFVQGLLDINSSGGLDAVIAKLKSVGIVIDSEIITKQAQAAITAERNTKIIETNWNRAYASIYAQWKDFKKALGFTAENEATLSINIRWIVEGLMGATDPVAAAAAKVKELEAQVAAQTGGRPTAKSIFTYPFRALGGQGYAESQLGGQLDAARAELERQQELARERARLGGPNSALAPEAKSAESTRAAKELQLNLDKERLAVLGEIATNEDKMKVARQELALTTANVTSDEKQRVLAAKQLALDQADVQTKTKLGIATISERDLIFNRELEQISTRLGLSEEQRLAARRLYNKELESTRRQELVRSSDFPALTQLTIDAGDLRSQMDQGLAGALRSSTSDMYDMARGAETLGVGLGNLAEKFASAIAQAILMKTVVQPIAGALTSFLPSFGLTNGSPGSNPPGVDPNAGIPISPSAHGNVFNFGHLIPFARGGVLTHPMMFPMARGAGLAGEAGPEAIIPLARGADGNLGVRSSGGSGELRVYIENASGTPLRATQKQAPAGFDAAIMLEQFEAGIANNVAQGKGSLGPVMEQKYGLGQQYR